MIKISELDLQTLTIKNVPIEHIKTLQDVGYNISQLCRMQIATKYKEIKEAEK